MSRLENQPKKHKALIVGLCGRAGSGKTTLSEKIKLTLRKFPATRHNWGLFAWSFGVEFHDFNDVINCATKDEFIEFFREWESISRAYREVLKEKEFKLSPEEEAKRFQRASEFQEKYKKEQWNGIPKWK